MGIFSSKETKERQLREFKERQDLLAQTEAEFNDLMEEHSVLFGSSMEWAPQQVQEAQQLSSQIETLNKRIKNAQPPQVSCPGNSAATAHSRLRQAEIAGDLIHAQLNLISRLQTAQNKH